MINRNKLLIKILATPYQKPNDISQFCGFILIQQIASHIFPVPMVLLFNMYLIEASSCLVHVLQD